MGGVGVRGKCIITTSHTNSGIDSSLCEGRMVQAGTGVEVGWYRRWWGRVRDVGAGEISIVSSHTNSHITAVIGGVGQHMFYIPLPLPPRTKFKRCTPEVGDGVSANIFSGVRC